MTKRNRILYGLSLAGVCSLGLVNEVVVNLPLLHAAACNGSNPCKVCKDCSRCKYCKAAKCGVCSGEKPRRRQSAAELREILKGIDSLLREGA